MELLHLFKQICLSQKHVFWYFLFTHFRWPTKNNISDILFRTDYVCISSKRIVYSIRKFVSYRLSLYFIKHSFPLNMYNSSKKVWKNKMLNFHYLSCYKASSTIKCCTSFRKNHRYWYFPVFLKFYKITLYGD